LVERSTITVSNLLFSRRGPDAADCTQTNRPRKWQNEKMNATQAERVQRRPPARRSIETPLGTMWIEASDAGVVSAGWYSTRGGRRAVDRAPSATAARHLEAAAAWFAAYFAGDFDAAPFAVDLSGTELTRAVWTELERIPVGTTRTYGEIARTLGHPRGARAVGAAVGANPVAVRVPCHRVIGANGDLTGFAAGIERKQWLLRHEGALLL
jgi:methylated-DNA-[protein]-cysteine S-methyltransferase